MCFLAPLLFLGFAQAAIAINAWEASTPEAAEKAAKKDADKPKPVRKLNPVDEFLGAPAPEDPSKKKDEKKDDKKDKSSGKKDEDEKPRTRIGAGWHGRNACQETMQGWEDEEDYDPYTYLGGK